ncbi:MAG: type IV pilus assembly protein PilM [bacterium]|nr:type IV pilus assembly protein PilM [bacterium]
MSFLSKFFTSSYLGVDIGTSSIKVAEVTYAANRFKLKNYGILESYGHLERMNDALQTSSLKLYESETVELLRALLNKMKPGSRKAIASIPAFASFVTLLDLPVMSNEETLQAMPFQARQFIPLPISEVAVDWVKVGEFEDEGGGKKQQVLLIAVPQERIQKYQKIFSSAGLDLIYLEIEGLALTRSLIGSDPTPTIILDIGSRSTNILISDQGALRMNAQTDFAGGTLTQAISNGLNIDVRRAEKLKKQRGLQGVGGEQELSTLMYSYLDAILGEVGRVREKYETSYNIKIERMILSGGTALLPGINDYIKKQTSLPVVRANPFAKIEYAPNLEPIINDLGPMLAVATGLGIRGLL